MVRRVILICTVGFIGTVGCRAPAPSLESLSPFGSPRVPPPATGSYQQNGTYYSSSTGSTANPNASSSQPRATTVTNPAAVGTGTKPANSPPPAPNLMPPPTYGAATGGSLPGFVGVGNSAGGSVAPASYMAPVQPDPSVLPPTAPAVVTGSRSQLEHATVASSNSTGALKLNGMRVNDATQPPPTGQVLPPATGHIPGLLQVVRPRSTNSSWQSRTP